MSNVKLQASASGTGTVTIAPPVTNSDLTINLPANSGTVPTIASVVNNGVVYTNSTGAITSSSALTFDGTNYLNVTGLRIGGSDTTNTIYQATGALALSTGSTSSIIFNVNLSEGMRLTTTGLGIGTNSPVGKLDVRGASYVDTDYGYFRANNALQRLRIGTDGSNDIYLPGAAPLTISGQAGVAFSTALTERMRLDSSGNLGIGTSSPVYKLDVQGGRTLATANSETYSIGVRNRASLAPNGNYWIGATNAVSPDMVFSNNAGTENMRLTDSGNLGLGVTPSAWYSGYTAFQVQNYGGSLWGRSGSTDFGLTSNLYRNAAGSWITPNAGKGGMYIISGSDHLWYTTSTGTAGGAISLTQAMTLDSSGRLMVGYTSNTDGSALQINANSVGSTVYTAAFNNSSTSTSAYNAIRFAQGASGSAVGVLGTGGSAVGNTAFQNTFGIGTQTTHALTFITADTERARITSGGNLCVGATSGNYRLNVVSASHSGIQVVTAGATTGLPSQDWYDSTNGTEATLTTGSGFIQFGAYTNHPLLLTTNNTERARITTGGDFVIGKTAASESYTTGNGYGFAAATTDPFFSIVNVNGSGANGCIYLNRRNVGSASLLIAFLSNNGSSQASVGSITHNGSNTAYNTASDYRLKYDIAPMTGALAKVALLKPCTYKWNVSGADGEGFIAHELAEVCPQAVTGEKDAVNKDGSISPQGIDTSYLVATLTAAIQELKAEFDAYKATHP